MAKILIRLPGGEWEFDDSQRLGKPGGFGEVFNGAGPDGPVAIKRLLITADDSAHRELAISQQLMNRQFKHVVPIIDSGQDANSNRYFIVMPVCDHTLQDVIDGAPDSLTPGFAKEASTAIVSGLMEVNELTHRDLKPSNVLMHEGLWKIADFGIAKFVEDATSLQTLRDALTPSYAAPEQWNLERPATETDIYALGCIIHALMTGEPPFVGDVSDLKDQHLNAAPPQISNVSDRVAGFVSQMLRKQSRARPRLARCAKVLAESDWSHAEDKPSYNALDQAARQVADVAAKAEAEALSRQRRIDERQALLRDAIEELGQIRKRLFDHIKGRVDLAMEDRSGALMMGRASIDFRSEIGILDLNRIDGRYGKARYEALGWDILAWSMVGVADGGFREGSAAYIRTASLIYTDRNDGDGYRWYEVAFTDSGFSQARHRFRPFGLEADDGDLYAALGTAMHTINVAFGPIPIDGENEDEFAERWITYFSKAAVGDLTENG